MKINLLSKYTALFFVLVTRSALCTAELAPQDLQPETSIQSTTVTQAAPDQQTDLANQPTTKAIQGNANSHKFDVEDYQNLVKKILEAKQPTLDKRIVVRAGKYAGYFAATASVALISYLLTKKFDKYYNENFKFHENYSYAILATCATYLACEFFVDFVIGKKDPMLTNLNKLRDEIEFLEDEKKAKLLEQFKNDFITISNKISAENDSILTFSLDHANNFMMLVFAIIAAYLGGDKAFWDDETQYLNPDHIPENIRAGAFFCYAIARVGLFIKRLPKDRRGQYLETLIQINKFINQKTVGKKKPLTFSPENISLACREFYENISTQIKNLFRSKNLKSA